MRRTTARWIVLLAVALVGCAAKHPPANEPATAPPPPSLATPVQPVTPEPAPAPKGPAVVPDGAGLRLVGIGDAKFVDWAPSGQTALVEASPALYRLRIDTKELHLIPDLGSYQKLGWAGPDTALLIRWSGEFPAVGELSLLTGTWHPLARVSGPVAICQRGGDWIWVEIKTAFQGGGGTREIGAVYRTLAPAAADTSAVKPLTGEKLLEKGALLGRLADGSCLLDGMDRRLLLLRPNGELQTISQDFSLTEVTRDGRGVVWLDKAGDCRECIELGPGVPFQRLTWWRLEGKPLQADLGSPQVISYLLSPDGQQLMIGHQQFAAAAGAVSLLSAEGFHPGKMQMPALIPTGWSGSHLLLQPAGPDRWSDRGPVYQMNDTEKVGDWITSGVNGSLLLQLRGELRYLSPEGKSYRLSHSQPFLRGEQGIHGLGVDTPQAPYLAVQKDDGLLLVRLEPD